ncbi:MAG: hypothetical protein ACTSQE_15540 [Candidatus Heimdallarchaeaceae archaeon]
MDFKNVYPLNKDKPYLRTVEKLYILALRLYEKYDTEFSKPVCIIIKLQDAYRYRLSRMIQSLFLLKGYIDTNMILPIDTQKAFVDLSNKDVEGDKWINALCNISIDINIPLQDSKTLLQAITDAIFMTLSEKMCSIILYEYYEELLSDKITYFRQLGYNVQVVDITEIEEYTRVEYQPFLQDLQFMLTLVLWQEMIEKPENTEYLKDIAITSINSLTSAHVAEILDNELFSKNQTKD